MKIFPAHSVRMGLFYPDDLRDKGAGEETGKKLYKPLHKLSK